jgi:hypothetical protein
MLRSLTTSLQGHYVIGNPRARTLALASCPLWGWSWALCGSPSPPLHRPQDASVAKTRRGAGRSREGPLVISLLRELPPVMALPDAQVLPKQAIREAAPSRRSRRTSRVTSIPRFGGMMSTLYMALEIAGILSLLRPGERAWCEEKAILVSISPPRMRTWNCVVRGRPWTLGGANPIAVSSCRRKGHPSGGAPTARRPRTER